MCVIDLTVDSSSDEDEPAGTVSQVTQKIDQIKTDMDCVSQNSGAAKNQEQLNNKKSTKVISDSETPDLMRFDLFDNDNFLFDDLVDGYNISVEHESHQRTENRQECFNKNNNNTNNTNFENISFIMVD